jgi:hypothetical protein
MMLVNSESTANDLAKLPTIKSKAITRATTAEDRF